MNTKIKKQRGWLWMFLSRRGWAVMAVIVGVGLQGFVWKLDQERAAMFAVDGVVAQAELLHVAVTDKGWPKGEILHGVFQFDAGGQSRIAQAVVPVAIYDSAVVGDVVEIRYLRGDPSQIEYAVGAARDIASASFWRLVLVALIGLGVLAGFAVLFKNKG